MNRALTICACLLFLAGLGAAPVVKTVTIQNRHFAPAAVRIHVGDEVVWTNADDTDCTVDADDGSFSSPTLKKGDSFTHRFTAKGTISYGSRLYPRMRATIVVE